MCVCVCTCHCTYTIHSSVDRLIIWTYFYVMAIVNKSTVNMRMQICLQDNDYISFGYMAGSSWMARSYASSSFNFFRNLHIVFHTVVIPILQAYQQYTSVPFSPHPHQHLSIIFLIIDLIGLRWYLIMVLICVSLMVIDVKSIFMYVLAICMIFFLEGNVYSHPLPIFKLYFVSCYWVVGPLFFCYIKKRKCRTLKRKTIDCKRQKEAFWDDRNVLSLNDLGSNDAGATYTYKVIELYA